ncbi:extracellular solute-binding protein [Desulfobacula sp.]|uniref:extracellular solute-binding protein n=1 Tax=Desulfobacula sp. TaxID=2593537 RepID=UPI002631753E|nr:extracellular solute-binding protein [Desulfobacula sp.]
MTRFMLFFLMVLITAYPGQGVCMARQVVVYTSVDQVFSEPILKAFEKKTGITVRSLYDVEAAKTVGLVNRLMAEKKRPKADVFWNSEVTRTLRLKEEGVLTPYQSPQWQSFPAPFKDSDYYWTGFSARARVLIWHTGLLKESDLPESIFELTQPKWQKKVALAYPLFGTTSMHVAALYSIIGPEKTEAYLKGLAANQVIVVNGNSVTRDLVVEGKIPIGFTDTDDVNVAILKGAPVRMYFPDKKGVGTLLIPNTVALIKNGPNPETGKQLIDYLLSRETESRLAFSQAAQMPVRTGVKKPENMVDFSQIRAMAVDYHKAAQYLERASRFCQELFVR